MRPWRRRKVQLIEAGFRSVLKNQNCEERDKWGSQQDVCGWSSWHEVLAFMFIFGYIFLSLLMQISGLGSNPMVQDPKFPKVSTGFWLGRGRSLWPLGSSKSRTGGVGPCALTGRQEAACLGTAVLQSYLCTQAHWRAPGVPVCPQNLTGT